MQIRFNHSKQSIISIVSEIKEKILTTLAYFDAFNYPLTKDEICLFLPVKYERKAFDDAIDCLTRGRLIYRCDKFYSLKVWCHLVNVAVEVLNEAG
jgi:hypothetical protein